MPTLNIVNNSTKTWSSLLYVLPTYRQFEYAVKCMQSLETTTPYWTDYSVAVVDDGSPDWYEFLNKRPTMTKDVTYMHFKEQHGLTRSWNTGLRLARDQGIDYVVCGNSDVLFSPHWYQPLIDALEQFDLVGPITNAPGHCPWQNAKNFGIIEIDDNEKVLKHIGNVLKEKRIKPQAAQRVNGFFMMAKTKTWWDCAYDSNNVFNPECKLTGNEDELQLRMLGKGKKLGFAPSSFIFHYRSVSRPNALVQPASRGAYRPLVQQ